MADERIIDQPTTTSLDNSDYLVADSSSNGTRKILGSQLPINVETQQSIQNLSNTVQDQVADLTAQVANKADFPIDWGTIQGNLSDQTDLVAAIAAGGGGGTWGSITGTLSDQIDLQAALDAKVTGPGTVVADRIAVFDGTTGKLIKDSGVVALNSVATSAGAGDAGKLPVLNGSGVLDPSFQSVQAITKGGTGAITAPLSRVALNRGSTTLSDAATIATDCSVNNVFTMTLITTARTMGAPTNQIDGATYIWRIRQDGTGGRTLLWNSAFKFPGGTPPVITSAANSKDVITGVSDGTNIECSFVQDMK